MNEKELNRIIDDAIQCLADAQAAAGRGDWRSAELLAQAGRHLAGDAEELCKREQGRLVGPHTQITT